VTASCRSAWASIARGFLVAALSSVGASAHAADFVPNPNFAPKADTYICPNAAGGAVECYLDAVPHLYTMCRQVKSIEIIEWGYEKSTEGTNGAKSEYCIDKHRLSMTRPYQAALKEADAQCRAVDGLRALQEALAQVAVRAQMESGRDRRAVQGASDEALRSLHRARDAVRAVMVASKDKAPPTADKGKKGKPATPPPKTKSAT
jgi:hypothetical protein